MNRCPNCRALLDPEAPQCRRCGLELVILRQILEAREVRQLRALRHLVEGEADSALVCLRQALALRADPLTAELLHRVQGTLSLSPETSR